MKRVIFRNLLEESFDDKILCQMEKILGLEEWEYLSSSECLAGHEDPLVPEAKSQTSG